MSATERLLLTGRRVLITRAAHQAAALSRRVATLGGEPVEAPTVVIVPADPDVLRRALDDLARGRFAAVCLTSPNGVAAVAAVLGHDDPAVVFSGAGTVACVGPGTATALRDRLGIVADIVPDRSTTVALAAAFPPGSGEILLARADISTPALADGLRARGYAPVEVTTYHTTAPARLPDDAREQLAAGAVDLIAFGSASAARNFATLVDGHDWHGAVVSIGPVTSATCRELGIEVAEEADRHDLDGLVAALCTAAAHLP